MENEYTVKITIIIQLTRKPQAITRLANELALYIYTYIYIYSFVLCFCLFIYLQHSIQYFSWTLVYNLQEQLQN